MRIWRFSSDIDSGLVVSTESRRGTTKAENAPEAPTQSHVSPSILVYEESMATGSNSAWSERVEVEHSNRFGWERGRGVPRS